MSYMVPEHVRTAIQKKTSIYRALGRYKHLANFDYL